MWLFAGASLRWKFMFSPNVNLRQCIYAWNTFTSFILICVVDRRIMSHDGFLAPKAFRLSGIEFYRLWAYLMMSVPEPTILDVYGVFFVYFVLFCFLFCLFVFFFFFVFFFYYFFLFLFFNALFGVLVFICIIYQTGVQFCPIYHTFNYQRSL
jgi:hypothetical protein